MTEQLPEGTIAVFATLCGATVALVCDSGAEPGQAHTWTCLGCRERTIFARHADPARTDANDHAGRCRSKPLPV